MALLTYFTEGIVFVLIAIRIHFTKSRTVNDSVPLEAVPNWSTEDEHSSRSTQNVPEWGPGVGRLEVAKYNQCTDHSPSQDTLIHQV